MPDGSFFQGGQGIPDPPVPLTTINAIRNSTPEAFKNRVDRIWANSGAPWVMSKEEFDKWLTKDELIRELQVKRPSVFARQGTLATQTRRGTGFYKVPSLRGVWFRTGFGHAGQAETLEEWFDPGRLEDGYVPKGFHLAPGPIEGHEKGLDLSPEDRKALIAFLKTL